MPSFDVRPPDLEMRIRMVAEHGKTRLRFTLHSPNGSIALVHREIEGPLLQRNPEDYQGHLLAKVDKLADHLDVDRSLLFQGEVESKLASLGRDLWRELFPPELRGLYRDLLRSKVQSWVIVSDEPWIPWELVKPYESGIAGEVLDDDYLCLRFELTRWLAGDRPLASELTFRRLAVVQSAPDLPHTAQERRIFKNLKETFPGLEVEVPRLDSASDLVDFLTATEVQLVHLIGHGTPLTHHPDDAGLPFPDRSVLRPADLHGALATLLGARRPMVFLNACWAGKEGWSLTRLGGWAARWIDVCGCSALVAPLWPVRDSGALAFAWSFYEALAHGATLGQAALEARRKVRSERPGDPSVLAYTVYGHPNARVYFKESVVAPFAEDGPKVPRSPQWRPRRRRPRWLRPLLATAGLVLFLSLASGPLADLYVPLETIPKPLPWPKPKSSHSLAATCSSGLQLDLSGGSSALRSALKNALCRLASSQHGASRASRWTLVLAVDSQQVVSVGQGELVQKSCRIMGHASTRSSGSLIDLGPVHAVNAQFISSLACEEAVVSVAKSALNLREAALSRKGEL